MKHIFPVIGFFVLLPLFSCSDTTPGPDGDEINDSDYEEAPILTSSGEVCPLPAANLCTSIPEYISKEINSRFTSLSNSINATTRIVFASTKELSTADQQLLDAYNQGSTLVFVDTDRHQLLEWFDSHNLSYGGERDASDDIHVIYALNNRDRHYFFDDFVDKNNKEELTNFPIRFDSVVRWMNTYAKDEMNELKHLQQSRAGDVYDISRTFKNQVFTHNYSVLLKDKELAHVVGSDRDYLTKSSSIEVTFTVYPLFSKEKNGSKGDYYIVEGYVNCQNAGMYAGKWTSMHGGVHARLCGFYMSELKVNAGLLNAKFPVGGTPVPQTTPSSTSYSSGFSWSIGGNINGKYEGGKPGIEAGISGSCSWNNSETRTLPDVSIRRNTDGGKIEWIYTFNNLPHTSSGSKYLSIPDLAISDFETYHTWIWWVPDTDKYKDLSKDLYAYFSLTPTYKSYKWYSTAADFGTHEWSDGIEEMDKMFLLKLKHPVRQ